jgi:hypothetical protein
MEQKLSLNSVQLGLDATSELPSFVALGVPRSWVSGEIAKAQGEIIWHSVIIIPPPYLISEA